MRFSQLFSVARSKIVVFNFVYCFPCTMCFYFFFLISYLRTTYGCCHSCFFSRASMVEEGYNGNQFLATVISRQISSQDPKNCKSRYIKVIVFMEQFSHNSVLSVIYQLSVIITNGRTDHNCSFDKELSFSPVFVTIQ